MSVCVLEAIRVPRGKGRESGALHSVKPVDLLKTLFDEMQTRTAIDTKVVDEVVLGCVTQVGDQGANIAQAASLYAGWEPKGSGTTVSSYCTSGITACAIAAAKITAGQGDVFAVGGVESMSRVPMMSDKGALFVDPAVSGKLPFIPNGIVADFVASREGFTREQLDQYAADSHNKAAFATEQGYFSRSLVPVKDAEGNVLLAQDESIRGNSSIETMAGLNPMFAGMGAKGGFDELLCREYPQVKEIIHDHHAGNSPGMVDGASLALLASSESAEKLGLPVRAKLIAFSSKRGPVIEGLTGGLYAAQDVLERAGMNAADIDLWEFNEGFAGIAMNFQRQLNIPNDRFNVNGSGIAMGHAMGATGVNILGMMTDELERRDLRTGLIAISGAAGIGGAMIVQRGS